MSYVAFWIVGMFIAGFWYGTVLVDGGLTPGQVMTTFFSVLSAFQGIEALLPHWLVLSKGMSAGSFLLSILNKKDETTVDEDGSGTQPATCVGNVDLVDVCIIQLLLILNRDS